MALEFDVKSLLIDTGVATTTYQITGLSFQPKAIRVWWCGHDSATDALSALIDIRMGMGFATSPTNRMCVGTNQEDGVSNTQCDSYLHDAAVIVTLDNTGALQGVIDIQSFDSDGITFVVDVQLSAAIRVIVELYGGADITDAIVVDVQSPAGTGNFDTTTIGFRGDILFTANTFTLSAPPAGRVHASFGCGAAVSASEQAVLATTSLDNQATTDTTRYCLDSVECIAGINTAGGLVRHAFVDWLSNGFTLNALEVNSQMRFIALVIKGGSWAVRTFLTQTDTSTVISVSGLSFTPKGGTLFSHGSTESTQDTIQAHCQICLGAFTSTSNRFAHLASSRDNVGGGLGIDAVVGVEYDACLTIEDATSAGANQRAIMDVNTMQADGVDFIMDDADTAQTFVAGVFVGDSPAAPAGNLPLLQAIGEA